MLSKELVFGVPPPDTGSLLYRVCIRFPAFRQWFGLYPTLPSQGGSEWDLAPFDFQIDWYQTPSFDLQVIVQRLPCPR